MRYCGRCGLYTGSCVTWNMEIAKVRLPGIVVGLRLGDGDGDGDGDGIEDNISSLRL